jgi:hypothetical protein
MKLHSLTLMATTALLAIVGCGGGDNKPELVPSVTLGSSTLTVPAAGATKSIQLTANVAWSLQGYTTDVQKWITISPISGEASDQAQTISVTVAANTDVERSATITVKSETKSATITINQEAYYPDVVTTTAVDFNKATAYKYQRYQLTGTVKNLSDKTTGIFNLVDEKGSVAVSGLTSKEVAYGTATTDFASLGVNERDNVTIIGYQVMVDSKPQLKYAYLVKKTVYSEPNPDDQKSVTFPYSADFTKGVNDFIVNNKIFPYVFDAIWTNSATEGMVANSFKNDGKYSTESWLYSPFVDLTNAKKPILVFNHIVNFFASMDVAKDQTSLWIRKQGGTWKQLAISFSYPDELGGATWESEDVNITDFVGSKIQIAFKYISDNTHDAGKWQILNVTLKENEEPTQGDNSDGTEDYNKPGWDWTK